MVTLPGAIRRATGICRCCVLNTLIEGGIAYTHHGMDRRGMSRISRALYVHLLWIWLQSCVRAMGISYACMQRQCTARAGLYCFWETIVPGKARLRSGLWPAAMKHSVTICWGFCLTSAFSHLALHRGSGCLCHGLQGLRNLYSNTKARETNVTNTSPQTCPFWPVLRAQVLWPAP